MGRSEGLDIVGRTAELVTARALLRRVSGGPSAALVVGGEAGVGRTRLIQEIAADARATGFRVAAGACLRMDAGAMPYAAIVAALRALVRDGDPAVAASLGAYRRDVARLVPEIARLATPAPVPPPPGRVPDLRTATAPAREPPAATTAAPTAADAADPLARLRLFEAVGGWLGRLAESVPLMLVIEDLHWADPATLDLVRSLALGLAERVLLVVTLRTDEPSPPSVHAAVAELVRDGAERLELVGLDRASLARLAATAPGAGPAADDEDALDRLHGQSGGNPFLALELIAAGMLAGGDVPYAGVPPSLRDILDARLASLDDDTLEVLRAAALHPGPIDDEVLAAVLGRPLGAVGAALRDAREAGVLVAVAGVPGSVPGSLGAAPGFRHDLQREVLVEQLGPGERRMLHGRFADALAASGPDPARATAIALHRDAAGDDERSLAAHLEALDAAERAFAFDAATRHARRAAELRLRAGRGGRADAAGSSDAAALLERASTSALLAGDPLGSAELAREALALVGEDAERAATFHDRIRWGLWEAGDRAGAAREVELAIARLGPAGGDLRARLMAQRAAMHMDEADPAPALQLAEDAIRSARELGSRDVEAIALGVRGRVLATHGRVDEGIASLREAVGIADELDNLQGRLVGQATLVTVLARCGRARDALVEADAALPAAEAVGLGRSLGAQLAAEAARSCFALGAWDEAARRVADGLARRPAAPTEARLRIVALRLAAAQGRIADAAGLDARLAALEPVLGTGDDRAALDVARAEVALSEGRPDAVRPLVDLSLRAVASGAERGSSLAWLAALAVRSEVDLALDARARGDEAAMREAAARVEAVAAIALGEASTVRAAWGPRADAVLAQVAGEQARLGGAPDHRTAAWDRAVATWDGLERPYAAAYARYRLAEARLAGGAGREAVAGPLRAAAATLRGLDARPLLDVVERLARLARVDLSAGDPAAAGGPAPDGDPLAALDLTPREREVLRLVAAGWSNARIADHLSISPKTASVHVSNILAKLGVGNRVEAAALAHRIGAIGPGDGRPGVG